VKSAVFSVIKDQADSTAGKIFGIAMSTIICLNIVFVLIDTIEHEPGSLTAASRIIEVVSVTLFSIEYLLRVWTADLVYPELRPASARLHHVVSFMAIIDLVSILPFYLPAVIPIDLRILRALRLVRLVRILKLGRYNTAMATIGRVLKKSAPSLISSVTVVALLMLVSSVIMYYVEYPRNPDKFNSAFSGLWWAVSTMTTVGYGDIFPVTTLGRILGAVIELLGVGLVAIPTGIISAGFMSELEKTPHRHTHTDDPVNPLLRLKQLVDAGVLSQEEFEPRRRHLLAELGVHDTLS